MEDAISSNEATVMDKVFFNEMILEEILENVDFNDLIRCQTVAKKWKRVTAKILCKRPSKCFSFLFSALYDLSYLGCDFEREEEAEKLRQDTIDHVKRMESLSNQLEPQDGPLYSYANGKHGFFTTFEIEDFLSRYHQLCPKFFLIFTHDLSLSEIVHTNPRKPIHIPVLFVDNPMHILLPEPCNQKALKRFADMWLEQGYGSFYRSIAGALAPNRYFSDFEITFTSWKAGSSTFPNTSPGGYPIKCVLAFHERAGITESQNLKNFLLSLDPDVPFFGLSCSKMLYLSPSQSDNVSPAFIVLTLAGENIQAACKNFFCQELGNLETKLIEFKRSLPFDPDQRNLFGYTLGFLSSGFPPHLARKFPTFEEDNLLPQLRLLFPKVSFLITRVHNVETFLHAELLRLQNTYDVNNPLVFSLNLIHFRKH